MIRFSPITKGDTMAQRGRKTNEWHFHKRADDWQRGVNHQFRTGDVIRIYKGDEDEDGNFIKSKKDAIGIVSFPHIQRETYEVKIWTGPKPWDWFKRIMPADEMYKVDEKSPIGDDLCERYPGPSNNEIIRLREAVKTQKLDAVSVEERVAALEEDMAYQKKIVNIKDDDSIEKVSTANEDEDTHEEIKMIDPLVQKRENIINEE